MDNMEILENVMKNAEALAEISAKLDDLLEVIEEKADKHTLDRILNIVSAIHNKA